MSKSEQILWDTEDDSEAMNYDGTAPDIEDGVVYIKELGCNCNPASGSVCGGCVDRIEAHEIGKRYVWRLRKDKCKDDAVKEWEGAHEGL
jgi:hypothetical protein